LFFVLSGFLIAGVTSQAHATSDRLRHWSFASQIISLLSARTSFIQVFMPSRADALAMGILSAIAWLFLGFFVLGMLLMVKWMP
jgi:hypothetical protein